MSTKVDPDDFIIVRNNTHGEVLTSREAVRYWDCRKISDFEYQVTNNSGAPNITDNIHFFCITCVCKVESKPLFCPGD